jgi:hypothetical protein
LPQHDRKLAEAKRTTETSALGPGRTVSTSGRDTAKS